MLPGPSTSGGTYSTYHGTLFELNSRDNLKTLRRFYRKTGDTPDEGVILDEQGNIYGTTPTDGAYGYGTVFKFAP